MEGMGQWAATVHAIITCFPLMRAPGLLLILLVGASVLLSARQPLPDPEAFFAEARKRLVSNPDLRAGYAYRERRTETDFNLIGRIGPGPVHEYEVFPGPTRELTYRRLVARDGVRVTGREIAEQDREHLARLEAHRKARDAESAADRERRQARDRARTREARAQADEVIALFSFTVAGRATLAGHPAILVEFARRPDARPQSREAKLAAAFEGRAWVHEHQFELMRIEATAVEDVSFGLGMIARLHQGATATLVRQPMPAGRWLPAESRFEGSGRALLLRRVSLKNTYAYSDYRPFDPDRLAAMLAGGSGAASPPGAP
jgi:hypothetical protein